MYIHERPDWPHFRWDYDQLTPKLAATRHRQGRIIGQMQSLGFELREEASLAALTSDVVKSSAIEGETLSYDEVRSSIARRLGLEVAGLIPSGRDVDGVVEMMLDATQRYQEPLTDERLFSWHSALFPTGRSGMRRIAVGVWRPAGEGPMQVVSGPYGRERVHFEAPEADRLADEMSAFLMWFNASNDNDPVLKAALAHFWFVTIHPFEDGNGRIGRAIADMALARADGTNHRFYSMSSQIAAERKGYYDVLESSQRGDLDITSWLTWFLDCLCRALDSTENILERVLFKAQVWKRLEAHPINDRQRRVINRLLDDFKGPLTSSQYAKLAKCSADTALRDIKSLIEAGVLVQNDSGGRSTSYRLAPYE